MGELLRQVSRQRFVFFMTILMWLVCMVLQFVLFAGSWDLKLWNVRFVFAASVVSFLIFLFLIFLENLNHE